MTEYVDIEETKRRYKIARDNMSSATSTLIELASRTFCDKCGVVDPPCGFYPMYIYGPDSVSGLICHDCDKKMRGESD